jgi:hypothetical protein
MHKRFCLLAILPLFWFGSNSFGQELDINLNDGRQNALPIGPSIITGTIVNKKGEAIKGAVVRLRYPDGYEQPGSMTITDANGRFSAYVLHYHQPYVDLEIIVKKKSRKTIRYSDPGMGKTIGFPTDKIVLNCRCR